MIYLPFSWIIIILIIIWDSFSWLPHHVRKLNSRTLTELLCWGASSSNGSISLRPLKLKFSTNHYLFQQNLNGMAHSSDRNGLEKFLESTNPWKTKGKSLLNCAGVKYGLSPLHEIQTAKSSNNGPRRLCLTRQLKLPAQSPWQLVVPRGFSALQCPLRDWDAEQQLGLHQPSR